MFKYLKYLSLLPTLIDMIMSVERIIGGARQGKVKQDAVNSALSQMFSMLTSVGVLQTDDVAKIQPRMPEIISLVVGILNDFGVFKHGS
mgnify:CR=1 FL=1